jgi:cytochrome c oxidase cbb3-type subunit 3
MKVLITTVLLTNFPFSVAQTKTPTRTTRAASQPFPLAVIERGQSVFAQACAFCHGRDAGGGETGPDLTRSKLVAGDVAGDKIGPVIRNGRLEKGMPSFKLSPQQITDLTAFIHDQKRKADSRPGGRRGVDVADLQTGNVEAGKKYFNGPGTCASCHSPTGDLAGVAKRYAGLELEKRMLYPPDAPGTVSVTLASGQTLTGKLSYHDEFTIGLTDESGWYQSWPANQVKYTIHAPAEAHVDLLGKYTDDDIHNLMAYLQTLR